MEQNYQTTSETPKLRIATTVTHTENIDKEIELPYYFKDKSNHICKLVSKNHLIVIDTDNDYWSAGVKPVRYNEDRIATGTPISQDEYEAAYSKAMMYVELINRNEEQSREKDENEEIDQILERRQAS